MDFFEGDSRMYTFSWEGGVEVVGELGVGVIFSFYFWIKDFF